MPAYEPPMSFFTAKEAICAFLVGSGVYSLYYSRFDRPSGMKTMTICVAVGSIGFGAYQLAKPYLRKELAKLEENQD